MTSGTQGVDFSFYKSSTLKRRIVRRMALKGTDKPEVYLSVLREKRTNRTRYTMTCSFLLLIFSVTRTSSKPCVPLCSLRS
ncbi:hypothetical protein [Pedobacter panaciterrae]